MKASLLAVLLVGLVACASGQKCNKTADFILDKGYIIADAFAPVATEAFGKNWTGTIFLPTNSAVNKLKDMLLAAAGLEEFPTGVSLEDVFATKGLTDVLQYHLLPKEVLDPSDVKNTTTLGPFKTELSGNTNATFCEDSKAELSVRVNVTTKNTTAYVIDAADPKNPAMVTGNQTVCEGTVMLINRVLLPCADSPVITKLIATLKKAASTTTNGTKTTNTTSGTNTTRGLSPSPSPAPSSASIAAQSLVAMLACAVPLVAAFIGF